MNPKLLIFSDDWGRHPSSCQHLTRHLLSDYRVTWVNTIGMRPPRLDWITVKRGFEKISEWTKPTPAHKNPSSTLPTDLDLIDAKMWPWMTRSWDRWLNQFLLTSQLKTAASDAIAITTIPIVSDLIGKLPVKRWIYYCVDDFSVWPGLDSKSLLVQENNLLEKVDHVVAVSETLIESVKQRGRDVDLLTHGVDSDFWNVTDTTVPQEINLPFDRQKPFALFWGVIDRRMNSDWLVALANQITDSQIILAGPMQDPDPVILEHPNIKTIGPIAFEKLPALARMANVLIMPYADLPVTRAMQPLKLKEYLATLKPVVASSLPAVRPWRDCLEMADSKEHFVSATTAHLNGPPQLSPLANQTQERLRTESWAAKACELRRIISA